MVSSTNPQRQLSERLRRSPSGPAFGFVGLTTALRAAWSRGILDYPPPFPPLGAVIKRFAARLPATSSQTACGSLGGGRRNRKISRAIGLGHTFDVAGAWPLVCYFRSTYGEVSAWPACGHRVGVPRDGTVGFPVAAV